MPDELAVTAQTSPQAAAMYEALQQHVDALVADHGFRTAVEALDATSLESDFRALERGLAAYNEFHRQERRVWTAILRRGKPGLDRRIGRPDKLEREFVKKIPAGRETYRKTFESADRMAGRLGKAGFDAVLADHLQPFAATLATPSHPFAEVFFDYFRRAGCSQPMIDEFATSFGKVNFDFLGAAGGGLQDARALSKRGVDAQVEILDYTEENGFSYLRGSCGPPEWAIIASSILAAAGISISAWVVVAIIVALMVTLALICALSPPGSWVRTQCNKLSFLVPIFRF